MCRLQVFLLLLCCLNVALGLSQEPDRPTPVPEVESDIIEDFLNNTEDESFEFNTIFEELEQAAKNKLDLNKANAEELIELNIIDELSARAIIDHIQQFGDLISLHELQTVDQLSTDDMHRLLPYVSVKGGMDDSQATLKEMLLNGQDDLFLRWASLLEDQKGFTPLEDGETGSRYLGSKDKVYARYKHSYENLFSYGFTMEKDAGEELFNGSNPQGFDFYSAHLFARNLSNRLRAVAIGDFAVRFGQGLILNSGFGRGKSADAVRIKRNGYTLRPYTSVAETDFMRGAGVTLGISDHIEFTAFGSRLNRDANIVIPDTLDQEEFFFSSLQSSGLHRTENEIADERSITQNSIGGNLKWSKNRLSVSGNVLYTSFDRPLLRNTQTYNQFLFNSDRLVNASLDYTYVKGNMHFFGETAVSDNGALASINTLLLSLDRRSSLAISYRNYDKKYQALNANGFGETTAVNNENGLYFGFETQPFKNWRLNAYIDIWQHPWLRFNVDAPSVGFEYLGRLTYSKRRKMEAYLQVRVERKQRNNSNIEAVIDQLVDQNRMQFRLHYSTKLNDAINLRTRLELSSFENSDGLEDSFGYLLYQDLIYKPKFSPFSLTSRIAIFDTDSFDSRIYAYENDLLYNFSIPAYFNKGVRYYLNLRYKANRALTLEFRIAQSRFRDLDVISSGLNEIQGNTRTEVKAQIRYRF